MARSFDRGEIVEVQREGSYKPWEPATYLARCADWRGWHRVELPIGAERLVDSITGFEIERFSSDEARARAYTTRIMFVPSRRIRKRRTPEVQP